jgi:5-dehydro-2-deoxygluconokinase
VTAFEVLTMGRIGVDIYPLQTGQSLRHVETFGKYLGGSATNVAVAAARYGRRAAVISRTGQDPFGDYIHDALRGFGVDDRFVTAVPSLPTPVTFCEIFPPDDFPLYFYRFPTAPDLQIERSELDLEAIAAAGIFWMTGTGLCQEPSRSATLRALEARNTGPTVFDLDYRAMFWPSRGEARRWYREALPHATVAVGNLDECDTAVGVREPRAAAQALHDAGIQLAIIKQGPAGVLASDGTQIVQVPPVPVEVVNGLGAGDAFGGALCHALASGWDLERTLRFCNAAGAIVASRLACADAMPTADEVEATMREGRRRRRRGGDAVTGPLVRRGAAASGPYLTEITPEAAGWSYSGLRIVELAPGGQVALATGPDEMIVLPLSGAARVTCDGQTFTLHGRRDVFDRVSDFVYLPRDAEAALSSSVGGRFALPSARAGARLDARYIPAENVPVELRGAGAASRQVNNFCAPEAFAADRLIAVEVLTPGGNWSSYPPHKHDEQRADESQLEEIYYFEVARDGLAYQRVYGSGPGREIDVCAEVGTGDVVLIPHGYHGPSMAAPGYDLYYLNVMGGPGERVWRFRDDPAHAWVRAAWPGTPVDPRLPMTRAGGTP